MGLGQWISDPWWIETMVRLWSNSTKAWSWCPTRIPSTPAILLYLHDPPSPSAISHNLTCSYPPAWYNSIGTDLPPGKLRQNCWNVSPPWALYFEIFRASHGTTTARQSWIHHAWLESEWEQAITVNALSCSWLRSSTWFLEPACAIATNSTPKQSKHSLTTVFHN